jgi:MSHA biogenesis protein MshE
MGLYELLEINQDLADALRISDAQKFSQVAKNNPNFKTITKLALEAALEGKTSVYEMFKVSNDIN